MSVLTQFLPGRVKKRQVFTSSGTFTPSARLLALGGWVEVLCVGGGGGSNIDTGSAIKTGGGGGAVVRRIVQVTGAVTVTIGAGGTGYNNGTPTAGGTTSFGSLVSANGGGAGGAVLGGTSGNGLISLNAGGAGAGGPSNAMFLTNCIVGVGGQSLYGYGKGGVGTSNTTVYNISAFEGPPNTGYGGSGGSNGTSGICIVEWFE
ncbi:MAG: hypothetical protein N3A54_01195 [Patescibacteria group bacterium]|nr:hypothetical protein [Patescibacteria group bacterium]